MRVKQCCIEHFPAGGSQTIQSFCEHKIRMFQNWRVIFFCVFSDCFIDEGYSLWLWRSSGLISAAGEIPDKSASNLTSSWQWGASVWKYYTVMVADLPAALPASRALCKECHLLFYFIQAMNKICPKVLVGCKPVVETQHYTQWWSLVMLITLFCWFICTWPKQAVPVQLALLPQRVTALSAFAVRHLWLILLMLKKRISISDAVRVKPRQGSSGVHRVLQHFQLLILFSFFIWTT